MSEVEIDFITILSSELIAEIVEEYFNKKMYKRRVKVVDVTAKGDEQYQFALAFDKSERDEVVSVKGELGVVHQNGSVSLDITKLSEEEVKVERNNKGRFVKREKSNASA